MSLVISSTYSTGIVLSQGGSNPVTVTASGTVSTSGRYAIYGSVGYLWTLTNSGVLTGNSFGVTLASGGTIVNKGGTSPGLISGGVAGVSISGAVGSVSNAGTIAGTRTQSIGVRLGAGGTVVNGSSQAGTATISGSYVGVEMSGGGGSLSNFGTIQATGANSYGVWLRTGGTVTNLSGTVGSGSIQGTRGVVIAGASGSVSNYGTITSTGGYGAYGVQIAGAGSINNGSHKLGAGVIIGGVELGSGSVGNYGTINGMTGLRRGVYATSVYGFLSVANSGTITGIEGVHGDGSLRVVNGSATNTQAAITGRDFGIFAGGGGQVVNSGTIKGVDAVLMFGVGSQSIRVVNGAKGSTAGLISGSQVGVYLQFYGAATGIGQEALSNYGTIKGTTDGVVMSAQSGGMTLINGGTIAGAPSKGGVAVEFLGGANAVMAVEQGDTFIGNVVAYTTGNNILDFASAATAGTVTGIGTKFIGFQNIWLDPLSQWSIAGSNTLAGGSGITLHGQSTVTISGSLGVRGSMNLAALGTVVVAGTGCLEVGTAGGAKSGMITVDPGFTMAGWGVVQGSIANNGVVEATGGTLYLTSGVTGGLAEINASSVLQASGAFAPAQIEFLTGRGTLQLAAGLAPTAPIANFGAYAGNGIELLGTGVTALSFATVSSSSGVLSVYTTGGGNLGLTFASGSYTTSQFHFAKAMGGSATMITFG